MATPLRMPDLGTVEGEVTLVRWLKAEGETVALGDPLFEVETDKGISEVEAALAGVLVKKLVAEGARAGSGEPIALIRRPGEPEEAVEARPPGAAGAAPAAVTGVAAQPPAGSFRPVSPVIRALAEKRGVDLAAVTGSGPGGRITREDVLRSRGGAAPSAPRVRAAARAATVPAPAAGPLRLSSGQAAVARKVSQSSREKPVYHVHVQVDMTKAIAFRAAGKAETAAGGAAGAASAAGAVSWDAILVKSAAMALSEEPLFRRWFRGDEVVEHVAIDVAVAVGIGDELYVPAVRGPAGKTVAAVSKEIEALARKAEARALTPQDVEESCFLVSNLGMFPIDSFDAIIYPEHSAALAVGATTSTPVSDGKNTWIAPLARLTLTVDHRLLNGRTAARFLSRVKQILETGAFA